MHSFISYITPCMVIVVYIGFVVSCKTPANGKLGTVARDRTSLKVTRYKHTRKIIYMKLDPLNTNPQNIHKNLVSGGHHRDDMMA
jgi:hypothetical protein